MLFFMLVSVALPFETVQQAAIDEDLFPRIGRGDRAAFEELYYLSERAIYAYALSLLQDPQDALDVVQDTYLKVRASAHLYQAQGKPLAWLFTIARNLSRDCIRHRTRSLSTEELCVADHINYSYINDPTDRIALTATLRILEEGEREIILLHIVSGLKHREIAMDLDLPLGTVLSRYHRGLKKLKKHLMQGGVQHG